MELTLTRKNIDITGIEKLSYPLELQKLLTDGARKYKDSGFKIDTTFLDFLNTMCPSCGRDFLKNKNLMKDAEGVNFVFDYQLREAYPYATCKICSKEIREHVKSRKGLVSEREMDVLRNASAFYVMDVLFEIKGEGVCEFYKSLNEKQSHSVLRSFQNLSREFLKNRDWDISRYRNRTTFLLELYGFYMIELKKNMYSFTRDFNLDGWVNEMSHIVETTSLLEREAIAILTENGVIYPFQ